MTLVVQVKALAWLRRSSTTFIRPLCLSCISGLRRPLQHAGLWRCIVEQEDRLLLRQSVVSADLVVFRPKIITLFWFLTLFGTAVNTYLPHLYRPFDGKWAWLPYDNGWWHALVFPAPRSWVLGLSYELLFDSLLGALRIMKEIKVFLPTPEF